MHDMDQIFQLSEGRRIHFGSLVVFLAPAERLHIGDAGTIPRTTSCCLCNDAFIFAEHGPIVREFNR